MVRVLRWVVPIAVLTVLIVACATVWAHGFIHLFGIDTQQSDNYDFFSGVGPVLITAIGLSTLVTGMWHAHNCHEPSCWRIGRHKIDGTPWCNIHHTRAREIFAATRDGRQDRLIELLLAEAEARARGVQVVQTLAPPAVPPAVPPS